MDSKYLAVAGAMSLAAGVALFQLIAPEPPSDRKFDGVTVQSKPAALSIHSEAAFVQCYLTINRLFGTAANLAAGETLLPW